MSMKFLVLVLLLIYVTNASSVATPSSEDALSNAHSAHLGLMKALASQQPDTNATWTAAASRASSLRSLMLSNPNEALRLIESLESEYSSHPEFASLQAAGHIESAFSSKSDITYSCGIRPADSNNRHRLTSMEALFRHDVLRSYKVHIPDDFPLRPQWTHRNVHLSGYILDDTAVLHHPKGIEKVTDYNAVTGFAVKPKGVHTLLMILADFPDKPGRPATDSQMDAMEQGTLQFFADASYGQATVSTPVRTPTLRLSLPSSGYGTDYNKLASEMSALSTAAGYNPDSFDFYVWLFPGLSQFGWAGLGAVGSKGVWNNGAVDGSIAIKVVCHELGHNFGLMHASAWHVPDSNPISASGANDEYGDTYDMMGNGFGIGAHYNAFYKLNLGWLDLATEASSCDSKCATNGVATFKLWPSDQAGSRGNINAVDLKRNVNTPNGDYYWISTKSGGKAPWPRDQVGLYVHVSQAVYAIPKTYILNTHTEWNNNNGVDHAALQVGESYSECSQNIHITNTQFSLCKPSGNGLAADIQACMGALSSNTLCCATAAVSRQPGGSGVLQIGAVVPSSIKVNAAVTILVFTEAYANAYVNCKGDTYSYYQSSTTCQWSRSGWQKVVATATDMKGRSTKWTFYVKVGSASGSAPSIGATDSWSQTCATGRVSGYVGTFSNSVPTTGPTTPPPPPPTPHIGNSVLGLSLPTSAAFSLRRLSPAYTGAAIQVRRSSDSATLDVGFTSTGGLDTSKLLNFIGGTNTGYVTTWYDQSGGGNHAVQGTPSQQPIIVSNGALVTGPGGSGQVWQSFATNTDCHLQDKGWLGTMTTANCQATCAQQGYKYAAQGADTNCKCGNVATDCYANSGFNVYQLKNNSSPANLPSILFNGASNSYLSLNSYPFQDAASCAAYVVNGVRSLQAWHRYFDFGTGTNAYMFATPTSPSTFRVTNNGFSGEQGDVGQLVSSANQMNLAEFHHKGVGASITASTTLGMSLTSGSQSITTAPSDLNGAFNNYIGRSQYADPYYDGWISEIIFYAADPQVASTSTQVNTFVQNIRTFYGF